MPFDPPGGWAQAMAHALTQPHACILDSALASPMSRQSVIAFAPVMWLEATGLCATFQRGKHSSRLEGDPVALFEKVVAHTREECPLRGPAANGFIGGWMGLWGFDLRVFVEKLPPPKPQGPLFPDLVAGFYPWCLSFDHATGQCELRLLSGAPGGPLNVQNLAADLSELFSRALKSHGAPAANPRQSAPAVFHTSREQWLDQVAAVKRHIHEGDIYQANLTRMVSRAGDFDAAALYLALRAKNPAPFGGFLDCGQKRFVLSSSPEQFLTLKAGLIETRPIKGTRPRGATPEQDARQLAELLASEKDRAELTMIVDLERNDLGRICQSGTVSVLALTASHSYARVHHLEATIQGKLRAGVGMGEILRATFPGGSISGAPKKRALEIIHELEPARRGPYTGSLFALSANDELTSNILIRTLLVEPGQVSYHVGGGITADSDAAAEWTETEDKARALEEALKEVSA